MAELLSPAEVETRPLKRRGRGYDREEVDQHLSHVSKSYRQIWAERDKLQAKVTKLFEDERALGEALVAAQRAADLVMADAEEKARRLIASARDEARRAADEVNRERKRESAKVERLKSVRRESEAHLRELADSIVALLGEAGTDLESALSMRKSAGKIVMERPGASVGQSPASGD